MPLKLLKRSHNKYNVVSKSTFLISVELLDNGVMECTLDTNSTGADCLLNISQRLGLHQPDFFGLRYISRGVPPRQRWADLERPLKKQLDKYAQDSQLSLGVMYYVSDVNVLKDEMTRYHYFLQLKSDVIDGKLNCSIDQAISLASYSLQAEFGDYDPERHTIQYLRDFPILPKELQTQSKYQDINMEVLYEIISKQYASLCGFAPPLAEIYYIMLTQSLDGYGQTPFPAKDDSGNDILFCVSGSGLVIRRRDWTHIAAFRFGDIKSLSGHKKALIVQGTHSQRSIQFHFTDPEVVKYVKKICLLQNDFYKECLKEEQGNAAAAAAGDTNNRAHNFSIVSESSTLTADQSDGHSFSTTNLRGMTPDLVSPPTSAGIYENQMPLHNNNNVPFGNSGNNSATSSTSNLMSNLGMNPQILHHQLNFRLQANGMNASSMLINQQQQQHPLQGSLKDLHNFQLLGNEYRPSMSRSSTPFNAFGPGNMSMLPQGVVGPFNIGSNNGELPAMVPSYRPAPDYQTAVQLKYGQGASNTSDAPTSMTPKVSSASSSNQYLFGKPAAEEEEEPIYENEIVSQIHSMDLREATEKPTSRGSSVEIVVPSLGLGPQAQQLYTMLSDEQSSYLSKPPPPYPGTGIRSPSYEPHTIMQDGTYTKLRPALNNHSDVLRQIEAQLRESSLSIPSTSATASGSGSFSQTKLVGDAMKMTTTASSFIAANASSYSHINNDFSKSKSPEKETASNKSSKSTSSYHKLSEHGSLSALSSTNTSSNSSLGMGINGIGSQQSSSSNLAVPHQKQVRRGSDTSKNHSKIKLNVGAVDIYSSSIDPPVLKEYQAIPKSKSMSNYGTAMKIENSRRNRCPNILPYEDNCIRLSSSRQNQDGYMNASPVSAVVSGRERKYIVGQLPLAGNCAQLWQMIWELDIKVVAALERDSTALFYPLDCATSLASSALNTMYFGEFQIVDNKTDKDKASSTSIARELTLIYGPKKQQRKVWILPYEDEWKDDVPVHTEHFLCFLEEVNSVQRKVSDPSKPLVVLCGTGAGRSGVLLLSDILLHAADSGHKLRCDTLLGELRMQRMMLVSTPSQYAFVLHTLEKYLAQSRLI